MAARVMPVHGRWAWDARGEGRAVRVSRHVEAGLLDLGLWRGETCVGTARPAPEDVAHLVTALTDGLGALAARPRVLGPDAARVAELEGRPARLEQRRAPLWRRAADAAGGWAVRKAARRPR
ncbi:hypothetical protein E9549_03455 [Blastococcus sp. MG754426]|uniref:hypothetical protein n=1 Tax=unclassified Blastococcus TaxID=2619396 RepID=UPI001EF10FB2|nr:MULTISPECIES: hypothetical protein [unclassified Blastococcus]MCF6506468.1 hypothetical protein [Blastococcus sp. MG754426]MCF6511247.1 hypothetical protein [Blastococcus sp. MG754427]